MGEAVTDADQRDERGVVIGAQANPGFGFHCARCSYDLRGVAVDQLCPECGTPVAVSMGGRSRAPVSGQSIASMVLGILAVVSFGGYGIGIILGGLGIIFGVRSKRRVREGAAGGPSMGFATTGIVCGIVGMVLGALTLAVFVWLIMNF